MLRRKISKNENGRDFVCGDLHGSYSRLTAWMDFVSFDKTRDRLFSVGDLVDRGPENEKCLMLLDEPWFFAVKGNHEMLMDHWYSDDRYAMAWPRNGGMWGVQYDNPNDPASETELASEVIRLSKKAAELPVMLTVERQDGKFFHVIHAELTPSTPISDSDLDSEDLFRRLCMTQNIDGDMVLWGRYLFAYSAYSSLKDNPLLADNITGRLINSNHAEIFNPELSHIYSGHTIQGQPTRILGQTNLDTGAYKSYEFGEVTGSTPRHKDGLTITEPLTDKFWLSNAYGVQETEVFVLL